MRYIRQFLIIVLLSFVGELLHEIIPLQIPSSIYGFILLFAALCTGVIKLPQVKETAKFLIDIMPLLFVPAGVGLLESWDVLRPILLQVIVILVVSTVLVMGVSGLVTQKIILRKKKERK